ncbi:MAG TPA: PilW family protein [Steroidobacteraceae bacterium]|jgi:type IV pilus assembly protein PilW
MKTQVSRQGGFSLIELSVAIVIALFLIGGVLTVEQGIKMSYQANDSLSQLEDNERFAMSTLAAVVQRAGYYPSPNTNTSVTALPSNNTTTPQGANAPLLPGWYIYDSGSFGTDVLFVRYMTATGMNINLCDGTVGTTRTYTNNFYLAADAANPSTNDLYCDVQSGAGAWRAPVELVSGIQSMSLMYGVNTTGTDDNVDTYMNAAAVTSGGYWAAVTSIQVQLQFLNPMYKTTPGQPQYVYFTRVIAVMARTGFIPS